MSNKTSHSAHIDLGDESTLDMTNRDPNNLNPRLLTQFSDVIGEPEGAHSADCVWINAFKCFNFGKSCCYTCLTFVCALPLALCWGCEFACLSFWHIWYITPLLRAFNITFIVLARLFSTLVHCLCDPCYEAASLFFTKIYVNNVTNAEPYRNLSPEELNLVRGGKASAYVEMKD